MNTSITPKVLAHVVKASAYSVVITNGSRMNKHYVGKVYNRISNSILPKFVNFRTKRSTFKSVCT